MAPRIAGPAILGMADLFMGAAPTKKGPLIVVRPKPGPAGGPPGKASKPVGLYGQVKYNPSVEKSGQVLQVAQKVLKQGTVATKAAAASAVSHRRPAALTSKAHVGAAAVVAPPGATPKQRQAVQAVQTAARKADAAARTAGQAAVKAKKSLQVLQQQVARQQATTAKLFGKGRGTRMGSLIEQAYAELGALPHPTELGLLETGEPDPIYDLLGEDLAAAADPNAAPPDGSMPPDGGLADPGLDALADAGTGEGAPALSFAALDLASLPPPPPMNTFTADYKTVGGVPYDESKARPPGFLVSFKLADGTNPTAGGIVQGRQDGYLFGGRRDMSGWPGEAGDHWIHVHGQRGLRDWWDDVGGWEVTPSIVARSRNEDRGPIVGNPMYPDFKAARVDGNGVVFWYPQEAPAWLTAPLLQAAALTKQAAQRAAADAAAADTARRQKDQADAEEQKRQLEAQNALAESQAASEARQAQSRAQATQADIETQAQQAELQQAKGSIAQQQQKAQMQARIQQQRAQQEARANEILLKRAEREPPPEDYGSPEGEYEEGGSDEGPVMYDEGGSDEGGSEEGGYEGGYDEEGA